MNKSKLQNNYKAIALRLIILAVSMGMLVSSCKKTEVVPYEEEPANHIVSYTVTNAQEELNGVVDDVDNTITVYLPYYLSIDYIVPEIKLSEGAILIDADGNEIDIREDLDPVPFDTVGYTYTVMDSKKTVRKYTLVTKILPYKDPLKLGYFTTHDENGNVIVDDTTPKEAIVNSRFTIYGNLESSSSNAKLTLINKSTNAVVPNGLKVYEVGRSTESHYITADISADVVSGDYYIVVEHQGRTAILPAIHMNYKKPYFGYLPKPMAQGDIVTLAVSGPNSTGEGFSGVNTGVSRAYIMLTKSTLITKPANFPEDLYGKPIELEIISQTRSEIKFKFPEVIPAGIYEVNMGAGGNVDTGYEINYSGFAIYFDFTDPAWGNGNLLAAMPYGAYEIKAKN